MIYQKVITKEEVRKLIYDYPRYDEFVDKYRNIFEAQKQIFKIIKWCIYNELKKALPHDASLEVFSKYTPKEKYLYYQIMYDTYGMVFAIHKCVEKIGFNWKEGE